MRVVAFFFCEPDSLKRHGPRVLLATLLHQLLRQIHAILCDSLELDDFSSTDSDSFEGLSRLLDATCRRLPESWGVFIIIDGLNECDLTTRSRLLPVLRRLGDISKLFLTSRHREDIASVFENQQFIDISEQDIQGDIKEYIERKLRPAGHGDLSDECIVVGDRSLREIVSTTLTDGSEGT